MNAERAPRLSIIHLTDAPPISVDEDEWPVIARSIYFDGMTAKSSQSRSWARVRQHADGRRIVYGLRERNNVIMRSGFLVPAESEEAFFAAVRRTCTLVELEPQSLFDDMPPEAT